MKSNVSFFFVVWGTRRFEDAHLHLLFQQLHQVRDVSSGYWNRFEIPRHMRYRCREENRPQAQTGYSVREPALTRGRALCCIVDR